MRKKLKIQRLGKSVRTEWGTLWTVGQLVALIGFLTGAGMLAIEYPQEASAIAAVCGTASSIALTGTGRAVLRAVWRRRIA
jgi:hypothetical protein